MTVYLLSNVMGVFTCHVSLFCVPSDVTFSCMLERSCENFLFSLTPRAIDTVNLNAHRL